MSSTLFILGRTPDMAFQELKTFFPDCSRIMLDVAASDQELPIAPQDALSKLGGTVKLAEKLGTSASLDASSIAEYVDTKAGRTVFGVSVYGEKRSVNRKLLEETKELLEGRGVSVRFVEGKGEPLSSVVVEKHGIQEILFIKNEEGYTVGRTLAVQPFESWNARDFGRPYADPKAGMLPPKVSRMAVNIADVSRSLSSNLSQKTLLDPFCGMGTILSEAMLMGWNVIGSDLSSAVVEKARKNILWLSERTADLTVTFRLHTADAVHISGVVDNESVDAIVTEPFMGRPVEASKGVPNDQDVKNTMKGLEKLYIGCLKDWQKILKPHGVVMMAIPMYELHGRTFFVKKVIDMCENLGYTIQAGPIEYSRPQAIVKRVFYLFQKI